MKTQNAFDIHAHITDHIVAAIEVGAGEWQMPWRNAHGALHRPRNIATGNAYQGVNILSLWIAAERCRYTAPLWGTYRQWQDKGAQVRKGEKGTPIVFYKEYEKDAGPIDDSIEKVRMARASWVFNAAQVDGFTLDAPPTSALDVIEPHEAAESLIAATGADIRIGGERAYYDFRDDFIGMPDRERFLGTATCTPTDAWYATQLHELTHWTGAKHRLARDLANRFGSEAYAMEELVAELGSAFLCADLALLASPRPDHAAYIAHWLKVLRQDKKAIFTAAGQADRAARFITECLAPEPRPPSPTGRAAPTPR